MNTRNTSVTIAYGDDIGPEIMECVLQILRESGAKINFNIIEIGENIYRKGFECGILPSAWDELNHSKVLLKSPNTKPEKTPNGDLCKDLNSAIIKKLSLHSNIRSIHSQNSEIDISIINENSDDFYLGIENRSGANDYHCTKTINTEIFQKIIREAFEYAIKNNRKKISCLTNHHILKMTDGIFHQIFNEVSKKYPEIESESLAIDLAIPEFFNNPKGFDVVIGPKIYTNIIFNLASQIGLMNLSTSTYIGDEFAVFEANCHLKNNAPSLASLIDSSSKMLFHIGQSQAANNIKNALLKTDKNNHFRIEEFTLGVIANLEKKLAENSEITNKKNSQPNQISTGKDSEKIPDQWLIGFDLFINWQSEFDDLIAKINKIESEEFEIKAICASGSLMWPHIDIHNRPNYFKGQTILRFIGKGITGKNSQDIINKDKSIKQRDLVEILNLFAANNIDFIKFESLFLFDGKAGYNLFNGEKI